jgi:hypothetical protein
MSQGHSILYSQGAGGEGVQSESQCPAFFPECSKRALNITTLLQLMRHAVISMSPLPPSALHPKVLGASVFGKLCCQSGELSKASAWGELGGH